MDISNFSNYKSGMNLTAIQTFLMVVETGNLNKAAERLHVTQSTVTSRLDTLEDAMGQRLLVRSRKGAELTKAGFAFHRHAESIALTWDLAKRTVGLPKGFSQSLSIAAEDDLWWGLGDTLVEWLRDQNPDIAIEAWPGTPQQVRTWLGSGLVDAGLTVAPSAGPGLEAQEYSVERIVQVSSVARQAVAWHHDYIYVDYGVEFRRWHAQVWPVDETAALTFGSGRWALQHLRRYGGSAYLPRRMVQDALKSGHLHLVDGSPEFRRAVHLVTRAGVREAMDLMPSRR